MTFTPEKPATLKRPVRKFVKRNGKRLMRRIARFQSSQSRVPDTPVIDNAHFDFLAPFQQNWETIQNEARAVLKYREAIPGFQDISPDQYRLATEQNWKTFVLFGFGKRLMKNTALTPKTASLLEKVPRLQTAMFSILAPGYHIPAHKGVTKGILRCHLGLIIPADRENCRIRVDDEIVAWEEGGIFVFDDTYEHEVWNDTDEERVILLFDFDRPMGLAGRTLNAILLGALKLTAFYKDPKRNLETAEARLESAIRQHDAQLEAMSHD